MFERNVLTSYCYILIGNFVCWPCYALKSSTTRNEYKIVIIVKHHCAKQRGHLQKHQEKKIQLFIAYPSYSHVLRKVIYDPAHVLQSNKYCDRLRTCILKKQYQESSFLMY